MTGKRLGPITFCAALLIASALAVPTSFAQPSSGSCVDQSTAICLNYWDELGYSSYKECRLSEYEKCMNGEPPYGPLAADPALLGRQADL